MEINIEKMKAEKEQTKSLKNRTRDSTRTKYFKICIRFCALISFVPSEITETFLRRNKFPTQKQIETILNHLKMTDRGRRVEIDKVYGKLKADQNFNSPYWHIFLQTTIVTTKKKLKKAFLKELKLEDSFSFQIDTFSDKNKWWEAKTDCQSAPIVPKLELDYTPGYLSDQTLLFVSLLEKTEIKNYLEDKEKTI